MQRSTNNGTQGLRSNSSRSSSARRLLGFALFGLVFFAFGYQSRGIALPSWLKGGGSSVRVSGNIKVDLEEIYTNLKDKFDGDLTDEQIVEGIRRGLVASTGDPYTTYFTKEEYEQFNSSLNGQFSGIGAEIGKKGDQIVVIAPIDGSPAAKAGVKAGDAVLEVDGKSTEGKSVEVVVSEIRGEPGSKVKLTVVSDGTRKDIEITRDDIKVDSVKYEKLSDSVGYIKISQFSLDTYALTSDAVSKLKGQGVNRIILDLRNNGGGYVDQAVKVAGIWLDSKVVLSERFRGREVSVQRTSSNPSADLNSGNQLVVLVNEGSASASEILAAALSEEGGVRLVGQKTFGKGSVQDMIELSDGSRVKITIAHWFTPKGKTIDKEGIEPVVKVSEGADPAVDTQRQRALELVSS
ncbi:MAG: carboxyl-terminal processing protease [Patescibacteria group bacterium]|nr:carboxyl-terminal processing protease [Patescibacteria group bacterium]